MNNNLSSNNDITYLTIQKIIKFFFQKMEVIWECDKPKNGPAVFIANHLGALGPILIMTNFEIRVYPWIISDMIDPKKQIPYLCKDFLEKELHLNHTLSIGVAHIISQIINPLFRTINVIPVYKNSKKIKETLSITLDLLLKASYILIFPEDPALQPIDGIKSFMTGFVKLGELYYKETCNFLPFYPTFISKKSSKIIISQPIFYKPDINYMIQKNKICNFLQSKLRFFYNSIENNNKQNF